MSEKPEHKKRYYARLRYIATFTAWLETEPPIIRYFAWRRWKKRRPIWKE